MFQLEFDKLNIFRLKYTFLPLLLKMGAQMQIKFGLNLLRRWTGEDYQGEGSSDHQKKEEEQERETRKRRMMRMTTRMKISDH